MNCNDRLSLIITTLIAVANFYVGYKANRISNMVEKHNREMEQIQMAPALVISNIYFKKSFSRLDYNSHIRLFWGSLNKEELNLGGQIFVKEFDNRNISDYNIMMECQKYKNRVYFTNMYDKFCLVCNTMKNDQYGIIEYCSTKIKLRNFSNTIKSVKANFFEIIDVNNEKSVINGLEDKEGKKQVIIPENGEIDIVVCFAITEPKESLCINDIYKYEQLPEEIDALNVSFDTIDLAYKVLTLNCTVTTIEGFQYIYNIVIDVGNTGFEAEIQYVGLKK